MTGVEQVPTVMLLPVVATERYDHQGGLDWPAMRGQVFTVGDYAAFVSDCGHVGIYEWTAHGPDVAPTLVDAKAMLAVLCAAVPAAETAAQAYEAGRADGATLEAKRPTTRSVS